MGQLIFRYLSSEVLGHAGRPRLRPILVFLFLELGSQI